MNIWSSIEAESWSRGFNYEDYLKWHTLSQTVGKPLCLQAYHLLCKAFDVQFEFIDGKNSEL